MSGINKEGLGDMNTRVNLSKTCFRGMENSNQDSLSISTVDSLLLAFRIVLVC